MWYIRSIQLLKVGDYIIKRIFGSTYIGDYHRNTANLNYFVSKNQYLYKRVNDIKYIGYPDAAELNY